MDILRQGQLFNSETGERIYRRIKDQNGDGYIVELSDNDVICVGDICVICNDGTGFPFKKESVEESCQHILIEGGVSVGYTVEYERKRYSRIFCKDKQYLWMTFFRKENCS